MNKEKIVGHSYPRKSAVSLSTGEARFVGDMKKPNMLHAKMLLSTVAHADIKNIDVSEALKVPGVKAIATCFNTPQVEFNSALRFYEHDTYKTETLFPKRVRFVGDRVAAVAAETMKAAEEAVSLIKVEYEELPAVFDVEEALKEDAPKLHEDSNVVLEENNDMGDVDKGFKESDHIFEDRYEMPAIHHGAMEPHGALAHYDHNDKLTVWSGTQSVFAYRIVLSQVLDMPMNNIRVIKPSLGGAFGGKLEVTIEHVAAILSKMTRRPVRLILNRKETLLTTRTRHGAVVYVKTGVKNDGSILAQDIKTYINSGAYAGSAENVLGALAYKMYSVYKTPNLRFRGKAVYTNTLTAGAMRGFGSPQLYLAQQAQVGKIARELGMDLVEFQLKNSLEPMATPSIGNGRLLDCIKEGSEIFEWEKRKKAEREEGDWVKGIGMSIGSHDNGVVAAHRDCITLILKLNEDGTATLNTAEHDMGNGSTTLQAQIVAEILGLTLDQVALLETDTDACAWNLGSYASRGAFVGGGAAKKTAKKLRGRILVEASEILSVEEEDLILENGYVVSKTDSDKRVTLSDVAVYSQKEKNRELTVVEDFSSPGLAASYGAHFAEVLVNKENGKVKVTDYLAVQDIGKAINPIAAEGQVEGGIHMGLGYALSEGYEYDKVGNLITDSFARYRMFRTADMPKTKVHFIENPEDLGPYGAKCVAECCTVPVAPAILNAVSNATGKDIYKLPIKLK